MSYAVRDRWHYVVEETVMSNLRLEPGGRLRRGPDYRMPGDPRARVVTYGVIDNHTGRDVGFLCLEHHTGRWTFKGEDGRSATYASPEEALAALRADSGR
jgi:hypothetical protein